MNSRQRIAWLRDRITQMGHSPNLYYEWHDELEQLIQATALTVPPPVKVLPLGTYAARRAEYKRSHPIRPKK